MRTWDAESSSKFECISRYWTWSNWFQLIPAVRFQRCSVTLGQGDHQTVQGSGARGLTGLPCPEWPENNESFTDFFWIFWMSVDLDFSGVTVTHSVTIYCGTWYITCGAEQPGSTGGAEWGEKPSGTPGRFRRKGGFRSREEEENQRPLWWSWATNKSVVGTTWNVHDVESNAVIVDAFLEMAICNLWISWCFRLGHHYFNFSLLDETSEDSSSDGVLFTQACGLWIIAKQQQPETAEFSSCKASL